MSGAVRLSSNQLTQADREALFGRATTKAKSDALDSILSRVAVGRDPLQGGTNRYILLVASLKDDLAAYIVDCRKINDEAIVAVFTGKGGVDTARSHVERLNR